MLEKTKDFLRSLPKFSESGDGTQATCECWYCGGYKDGGGSMSIKINPDEGSPIVFCCFRAACGNKGYLKVKDLELAGCTDSDTLLELDQYNKTINLKSEKRFIARSKRDYEMVNLDTAINRTKLKYINKRLGLQLEPHELREYKIQLSLFDFLKINNISRLAFNPNYCDILNSYTIGFVSIYSDYLILRDVSKAQKTGKRYIQYRASGKPDPNDTKMYKIPGDINLLNPKPAIINVAEGAFSILGAYFHCGGIDKKDDTKRNRLWLANCGSEYKHTIQHVVKQFGLLDVELHIWSDSEIKISKYEKLIRDLDGRMNLMKVYVHYNTIAEDFGHPRNEIKVETVTLI